MDETTKRVAAAKAWLESVTAQSKEASGEAVWHGGFFDALSLSALRVSRAEPGRVLCALRVPPHLADEEGNWHPGAIATAIDDVGAAAIMTMEGVIKVSVEFDIAFFSPAKIDEEVEIDARQVERKGKLTAMAVEIRKKGSGQLVAVGRQWMASGRPLGVTTKRSKL